MQASLSDFQYAAKKRGPRRDQLLREIDAVTPRLALIAEINPFYPQGEGRVRPPIGAQQMLRMCIAQPCFGLSDEGVEHSIYASQAIPRFFGIELKREAALYVMTLLEFGGLLEANNLTERIFTAINFLLAAKALRLMEGKIVDATIIEVPCSTKNRDNQREEEIHQTKKGNQWRFGMNAHIAVNPDSGLTFTLAANAANMIEITQAYSKLHVDETTAFDDAGHQGVEKRQENENNAVAWHTRLCVANLMIERRRLFELHTQAALKWQKYPKQSTHKLSTR